MDTTISAPAPDEGANGSSQQRSAKTGAPGQAGLQPGAHKYNKDHGAECASCEAQRKEWRDKRAARKGKSPGQDQSQVSASARVANPNAAAANNPPPVPWSAEPIKPLVAELIAVSEKTDIKRLKRIASVLSPEVQARVEAEAPWNETAKTGVISGGAHLTAKALNKIGCSAEDAPVAALVIGGLSLIVGRIILTMELTSMRHEELARRKAEKDKKKDTNGLQPSSAATN